MRRICYCKLWPKVQEFLAIHDLSRRQPQIMPLQDGEILGPQITSLS